MVGHELNDMMFYMNQNLTSQIILTFDLYSINLGEQVFDVIHRYLEDPYIV